MVGKLKQWRHVMLKDTGPTNSHQEALNIDEWVNAQKKHEETCPLTIGNTNFFQPTNSISIAAEPRSEQDVVALFNQLLAGGVIRGIKLMASSSHKQYDGLFRFHFNPPVDAHIFEKEMNPLGVEEQKHPEGFTTKPYVLEFKYGFDQLVTDFDNEEKSESSVDLAVVWTLQERFKERYQVVTMLHPDNLHLREFHGVTHQVLDDHSGEKRMDLIVLSDLIAYLNDPDAETNRQFNLYMK